ncbi:MULTISPECIES: hypothetical protein [unclassified Roseovarius]|uniref:hypothetical protein n=1 Tax=unclassified Roseovarius TaxID=2614913 RepID=UPI00273DD503|nr:MULTISPECIES: hypothetical protein [unclassified Roseovarius]
MFIRTALLVAATALGITGLTAEPASAATYSATSFYGKTGNKANSAIFNKRLRGFRNRLRGAKGRYHNNFYFENSAAGAGTFKMDGNKASLTGILRNAAGQGYEVTINYQRTKNPGVRHNRSRASTSDWSYFKMTSGTMTSLNGELASFDLSLMGRKWDGRKRRKVATQFGVGANNWNRDLLGLFTRFRAVEQNCDRSVKRCRRYNGSFKLVLTENDPPAPALIDDGNTAVVPLPASALLLPAAIGMLGLSGGIARLRRQA